MRGMTLLSGVQRTFFPRIHLTGFYFIFAAAIVTPPTTPEYFRCTYNVVNSFSRPQTKYLGPNQAHFKNTAGAIKFIAVKSITMENFFFQKF
jgi:hypothetical protein